jgi:thioredoxin reductase
VVVFTNADFEVPTEAIEQLRAVGVRWEASRIARLVGDGTELAGVELEDGKHVPCDLLFAHPPQCQVELVAGLGLALDDDAFVKVDAMTRETSTPGIYAAGDLTTRMQGATLAAASAVHAAAMLNLELTVELASAGAL